MYAVRPHAATTVILNCTEAPLECLPLCPGGGEACSEYALPPPPPPPPIQVIPHVVDRHAPARLLLVVALLSAFLFLSLALSTLLLYRRRRRLILRRRRRRLAAAAAEEVDGEDDEEEGGGGGGAVVHHVWYIRTVGLDEATIASIAAVEYRRGVALDRGGGDCAVCLGEFGDGELVRLLPRCAHPFHAPCIDTWLRAHVNCPICRSPVVVVPSESDLPVVAAAEDEAGGGAQSVEHHVRVHEETSPSQSESETEASESEESEASSATQSEGTTTANVEESGSATPKPIRRSASMDSPLFLVAVPEAHQDDVVRYDCKLPNAREMKIFRVKEKEAASTSSSSCQSGRFKIGRSMSSSGQGFFFSRNGRSSGAVLPL